MVVLCAGMFRSGSTWQYQVTVELAKRSGWPFTAHGMPASTDVPRIVIENCERDELHILKTHSPDYAVHEYLPHRGVKLLYSYRDLRDIAYSMAHKLGGTFDEAISSWRIIENCRISEAFWTQAADKVVQRYELWIHDERPFIARIASKMGIESSREMIEEIRDQFCLSKQKRKIREITERYQAAGIDLNDRKNAFLQDEVSLLHWNHIREGRVGHWRSLATPEQKQQLLRLCGDWLLKRNYEHDNDWAVI